MASDPIVVMLNQVSATTVRVEWSQPSEGATVTGYVVHYSDGTTDRMKSVAASSTSTDIPSLSSGRTYTISVEATSSQLSGESEVVTIAVGECISLEMCKMFVQYVWCHNALSTSISHTGTPLAVPVGVMHDVGSTSVTVSWQAVEDADRYTVTFTQTRGNAQLGLCLGSAHTASVSVATTSASITVGQDVEIGDDDMLRAYITYSITVVAESDESERINSEGSVPVTVTTAQTSMWQRITLVAISILSLYRCRSSSSQCHSYSCELHCHLCPVGWPHSL